MKVLVVITARGGSKGVPRKNLRLLCGKPLIAWSIDCALAIKDRLFRIVVSTDDPEIAKIAEQYGAEAPFLRPAELATDESSSIDAVRHAVAFVEGEAGTPVDWVLLLQPTSPLRRPEDIVAALDIATAVHCDSVIAVEQVVETHPMLLKTIEDGRLKPYGNAPLDGVRRQDCTPDVFISNGAIYLTRRDVVMKAGSFIGVDARPYQMPRERVLDIDSERDFQIAEAMLAS